MRLLGGYWPAGPGTGAGGGRAGSTAHEFPDEGAWQADVGGRGGVGDELCRGALHGRFGGPDAWLKALPDYQLGLVKCVDTGQNAAVSYPHSADVGKSHEIKHDTPVRATGHSRQLIAQAQTRQDPGTSASTTPDQPNASPKIRACHKIRSRTRASGPAPGSALSRPARS